jgi:hypothetical protein
LVAIPFFARLAAGARKETPDHDEMATTGHDGSARNSHADGGVHGEDGRGGERGPRPIREGAVEAGLSAATRWLLTALGVLVLTTSTARG